MGMNSYMVIWRLQSTTSRHLRPAEEIHLEHAEWGREETQGLEAAHNLLDAVWAGGECEDDIPQALIGDLHVQDCCCSDCAKMDVLHTVLPTSCLNQ